jgi:hypothetical protein
MPIDPFGVKLLFRTGTIHPRTPNKAHHQTNTHKPQQQPRANTRAGRA